MRSSVPGGTYFFTVNLAERHETSLLIDHIDSLRKAFAATRRERPFRLDAIVVLPDHLHCLWRLPTGDRDFSTRSRLIKSRFSREIERNEQRNPSRRRKGERGIWQRRYWEHLIRDDEDYRRHADYIHFNPVKHGHVRVRVTGRTRRFSIGLTRARIRRTGGREFVQAQRARLFV
jgi:putative transposase